MNGVPSLPPEAISWTDEQQNHVYCVKSGWSLSVFLPSVAKACFSLYLVSGTIDDTEVPQSFKICPVPYGTGGSTGGRCESDTIVSSIFVF